MPAFKPWLVATKKSGLNFSLASVRGQARVLTLGAQEFGLDRACDDSHVSSLLPRRLDKPTVGLHMTDAERLIGVRHRLVHGGRSIVVIEHDLDVIAEADRVIDLGPERGLKGRTVVGGEPAGCVGCECAEPHGGGVVAGFGAATRSPAFLSGEQA